MSDEEDRVRVDPRYALGQLVKALSSTGEKAASRVRQWQQVIAGMIDGSLAVGSRAPVAGTPPWVTLEVAHGGFATGSLAAAGPLLPHEGKKLAAIARAAGATDRAALNLYYLGDSGRQELLAMLREGRFRIGVPEEAVLLVVAWLIDHDEKERAEGLVEQISPYLVSLRFYPVPHPRPIRSSTDVSRGTVGEVTEALRNKRPQRPVEQMREAIQVWAPLYDRAVALFLETVEGDPPALRVDGSGELLRGPKGSPIVDGGWPCKRFVDDWAARAQALLDEHEVARAKHKLCKKPDRPKENYCRLRGFMARCIEDPAGLTGRDVGMIRKVLASYISCHGAPGSARLVTTRAEQARSAAAPGHHAIARILAERLEPYPPDEGSPDLADLLGPLSAEEARSLDAPPSTPIPPSLSHKAMRCLEAPIERLVELEVLPSSETLASVVPRLSGRVRAAAIEDPQLRRLYEATYTAFRRRRSLLLLSLESQVRLSELPWIAALRPWVVSGEESRRAARDTLVRVATLALRAFPHTILPNPMVRELGALARAAEEPIPLVEELAADIFMGTFSEKFLRAAQEAGRLLSGSLYERYYALPYETVLELDDVESGRWGAATSPGFAALCEQLAGARGAGRSPARNGTVIEQAQILTTHNLAALFRSLELTSALGEELPRLARRCFEWLCRRQRVQIKSWRAELKMLKNTAYAWRHMIFFISLVEPRHRGEHLEWARAHLARQDDGLRLRFEPAMSGLEAIVAGARFDDEGRHRASGGRRFLGWSVGRHWLRRSD